MTKLHLDGPAPAVASIRHRTPRWYRANEYSKLTLCPSCWSLSHYLDATELDPCPYCGHSKILKGLVGVWRYMVRPNPGFSYLKPWTWGRGKVIYSGYWLLTSESTVKFGEWVMKGILQPKDK